MDDSNIYPLPPSLESIELATQSLGFSMASERQTGALLRTLVASKPGGNFLELGTGTGLSTSWLLDGMSLDSFLKSVDNDAQAVAVAEKYIGDDCRIELIVGDGVDYLKSLQGRETFDLIFADTWPGKYYDLELALHLLNSGGFYVIDDMLPQTNWPDDHPPKVAGLVKSLNAKDGYQITRLCWSTGIIMVVKK